MALASSILDTGITWKIKDKFAVLLEWLSGEDLRKRKQICWIGLARNMLLQLHAPNLLLLHES